MAKESKTQNSNPEQKIAEDMQSVLESFLTTTTNSTVSEDIPLVSTGIDLLDLELGGGIGQGILNQIVGFPGSYKSTIVTQIVANHKKADPNVSVLYIDTENAMTYSRLEELGLPNVKPRSNYTLEGILQDIISISNHKVEHKLIDKPTYVIWDSYANTTNETEIKTLDINTAISLNARILSRKLPIVLREARKANVTLMVINQFRTEINMSMFPSARDLKNLERDQTLPGGKSLMFNSSMLMQCVVKTAYDDEKNISPYGFMASVLKIKTVKNKFFPSNYTQEFVIDPNKGIHNLFTNFELLKKHKKLNISAWNSLVSLPDVKFRLKELETVYDTNPQFKTQFDLEVKNLINELHDKIKNNKLEKSSDDDIIDYSQVENSTDVVTDIFGQNDTPTTKEEN